MNWIEPIEIIPSPGTRRGLDTLLLLGFAPSLSRGIWITRGVRDSDNGWYHDGRSRLRLPVPLEYKVLFRRFF